MTETVRSDDSGSPGGAVKRLLETAAEGVFVTTEDSRIVLWNRAAETLLGYRAREVLGRPCRAILPARTPTGTLWCATGCDAATAPSIGGCEQHFDIETRTQAGAPCWLSMRVSAGTDEDGRGPFVVHVFRDVTSSEQLHRVVRERLGRGRHAVRHFPPPAPEPLSRRELEVLRLLSAGANTADCAERLGVSRATVRNHVQNIFTKLGVHSRLQAVAYAMQHGLL